MDFSLIHHHKVRAINDWVFPSCGITIQMEARRFNRWGGVGFLGFLKYHLICFSFLLILLFYPVKLRQLQLRGTGTYSQEQRHSCSILTFKIELFKWDQQKQLSWTHTFYCESLKEKWCVWCSKSIWLGTCRIESLYERYRKSMAIAQHDIRAVFLALGEETKVWWVGRKG